MTVADASAAPAVCGRCHVGYRPPGDPPRFPARSRSARQGRRAEPAARRLAAAGPTCASTTPRTAAGVDCTTCHCFAPAAPTASATPPAASGRAQARAAADGRLLPRLPRWPARARGLPHCHLTDGAGRVR
ncbi:MAG: hypothetical protein M5U09_18890 [Gammaproteobacteria bacterium]|nr:hypothetical protein [Gammaproteobacteria bacterium]